ncbi:MAG: HPr family phosphocarrier protein [Succinivibrio sp.]|nr:HPr family phosphocarrier protein [Succinivibrio sp.]
MLEFTYTVKDPVGMHARPAGALISTAKEFKSEFTLFHKDKSVSLNGNIFGLLALNIHCGDELKFTVSGADEKDAATAMQKTLAERL